MQVQKWNGDEELVEKATVEELEKAMADVETKSATLHKPGSVFKAKKKSMAVGPQGQLNSMKNRKAKRKAQRQARRRNRR